MIKTFRGLLADGGQDRIRLGTIQGKVGYKIIKFQIIQETVSQQSSESLVQIWKTEVVTVPTASATVDFTDPDLLGVAYLTHHDNSAYGITNDIIIFDNEIFNQDIYVTHTDNQQSYACNYYLELEVIQLSDQAAEYTTIKDIRSNS
tara:strand:+ start:170 stop:610 length:441 start_codon:yes stop_codon:yes gene_type:complete